MDDLAHRRLDDLEKRLQQLEQARLMPTVRARPTDRFLTLHADRERPGAALGVVRERERNARLEGDDADDGA